MFIVPRNGYANRLQAWASASILAADLRADLRVVWEPEAVAPAVPEDIFSPSTVTGSFAPSNLLADLLGTRHQDLPRYLNALPERDAVVLAGHDRGEQAFMASLAQLLAVPDGPSTLVIIAGGKFHLPDRVPFAPALRGFYQGIAWSAAVDDRTNATLDGHGPFIGLHVRQTDRSREAPADRSIATALGSLRDRFGVDSLYLATDTEQARTTWQPRAAALGLRAWWMPGVDRDRGSVTAAIDAMAEWRVLASAMAIAYPAASTYSTEAAIAGGTDACSLALTAPDWLQRVRSLREQARSATRYPARRWASTLRH